jgi:acyl-CoA synthetase (AMP-forming)/AMP-acid ligase II/acyl carrier protein
LINTLNGGETFPDLRIIHLGGEAVLRHDVEAYRKHFSSNCILAVILGATEAPTFRQNLITKDTHLVEDNVPVGQPVQDKETLLLDRDGRPIKTNQVGEIAVRSHYLASGYWNKPELTNKVFLPDPSGENKKIYRTGDLGQLLPDGTLIYHGRKDNQVKIGGQRIEIAEIENVLLEHSHLKSCAVVLVGNIEEERYLAAYLEPFNRQKPNITELQSYLRQKLPNYMIPSRFVFLKSMPLLPNGKIDRLALPTPDRLRPELATDYVAPKSDLERCIADIWQELLRIDQIGINDDFFELGGHSLLATQLLSRINKIFKITLPLKRIFEASTVKTIAILIDMVTSTTTSQKRIINSAPEERETIVI